MLHMLHTAVDDSPDSSLHTDPKVTVEVRDFSLLLLNSNLQVATLTYVGKIMKLKKVIEKMLSNLSVNWQAFLMMIW